MYLHALSHLFSPAGSESLPDDIHIRHCLRILHSLPTRWNRAEQYSCQNHSNNSFFHDSSSYVRKGIKCQKYFCHLMPFTLLPYLVTFCCFYYKCSPNITQLLLHNIRLTVCGFDTAEACINLCSLFNHNDLDSFQSLTISCCS